METKTRHVYNLSAILWIALLAFLFVRYPHDRELANLARNIAGVTALLFILRLLSLIDTPPDMRPVPIDAGEWIAWKYIWLLLLPTLAYAIYAGASFT